MTSNQGDILFFLFLPVTPLSQFQGQTLMVCFVEHPLLYHPWLSITNSRIELVTRARPVVGVILNGHSPFFLRYVWQDPPAANWWRRKLNSSCKQYSVSLDLDGHGGVAKKFEEVSVWHVVIVIKETVVLSPRTHQLWSPKLICSW